jgi:hypothetical protein
LTQKSCGARRWSLTTLRPVETRRNQPGPSVTGLELVHFKYIPRERKYPQWQKTLSIPSCHLMNRAFSPQSRYCLDSWGVAPGWYGSGLRPSENGPYRQSPSLWTDESTENPTSCYPMRRSAEGPIHPRPTRQCAEGPLHPRPRQRSAEGADHISLGQRPRNRSNGKRNKG